MLTYNASQTTGIKMKEREEGQAEVSTTKKNGLSQRRAMALTILFASNFLVIFVLIDND